MEDVPCNRLRSTLKFPTKDKKKVKQECKVGLSCRESDGHLSTYFCTAPMNKRSLNPRFCGDVNLESEIIVGEGNDKVKLEECSPEFLEKMTKHGKSKDTRPITGNLGDKSTQQEDDGDEESLDPDADCDGDEEMSYDGPPTQQDFQPGYAEAQASDDCNGDVDMAEAPAIYPEWGQLVHLRSPKYTDSLASLKIGDHGSKTLLKGPDADLYATFQPPDCSKLPGYHDKISPDSGPGCQVEIGCEDPFGNGVVYIRCRLQGHDGTSQEVDRCHFQLKEKLDWCKLKDAEFTSIGFRGGD